MTACAFFSRGHCDAEPGCWIIPKVNVANCCYLVLAAHNAMPAHVVPSLLFASMGCGTQASANSQGEYYIGGVPHSIDRIPYPAKLDILKLFPSATTSLLQWKSW